MKLKIKGNAQEQLLLHLLGIQQMGSNNHDGNQLVGLLLGKEEAIEDSLAIMLAETQLYVRLPDTANPFKETNKLARLLAKSIGQAEIHL